MNILPSSSLSSSSSPPDDSTPLQPAIAVAIDKSKNSQQALKWAANHLVVNAKSMVLIHVRSPRGLSCSLPFPFIPQN